MSRRRVEGPIVLVGHSYGGAVISAAATGNTSLPAWHTVRSSVTSVQCS